MYIVVCVNFLFVHCNNHFRFVVFIGGQVFLPYDRSVIYSVKVYITILYWRSYIIIHFFCPIHILHFIRW